MIKKLHIDIETYSSVPIKSAGAYKYMESLDFEIILIAYAFDDRSIRVIDLAQEEGIPEDFLQAFNDSRVELHAHNAVFERWAFNRYGMQSDISRWHCSMVKTAYCGLPLPLDKASEALELGDKGKLLTGKSLIKYFCEPCKPTKVNGGRTRNLPHHNPEKWEEFRYYCARDVDAEREIDTMLGYYKIPDSERDNYILDQEINDRGIMIDLPFAKNAQEINELFSKELLISLKEITKLDNPNSLPQLKKWLGDVIGEEITSLTKDTFPSLIEKAGGGAVAGALTLRQKLSRTSNKKYTSMLNCIADDERAHGLFQFYGANRTGRWAGRLVQMQNLKQNHLKYLADCRQIIADNDYDLAKLLFDDVADMLSQLIRTAFIAKPGYTFAVADFSAIEARVIAWLANEKWRLDVFNSHGKIYEASASMMFGVPMEQITKGSDLRDKGKIAELALGYQGALGALKAMGGESMGLSDEEMEDIVQVWRDANPNIRQLWYDLDACAKKALRTGSKVVSVHKGLEFNYDGTALTIKLPSGRKLFYWSPRFSTNKFGSESIKYRGTDQQTGQWTWVDTYGGKISENVTQAIARDLLAEAMKALKNKGFNICLHVHDEAVCEVTLNNSKVKPEDYLKEMCNIMGLPIPWAKGLPLKADGYITPFYKKD